MTRGTLRIRLIALAAAYALALQGLFAAWAPMALAGTGFPLCSGEIADAPQVPGGPGGHDRGCLSACVSLAAAAIPAPSGVPAEPHLIVVSQTPAPVAQAVSGAPAGPFTARGPPAAHRS